MKMSPTKSEEDSSEDHWNSPTMQQQQQHYQHQQFQQQQHQQQQHQQQQQQPQHHRRDSQENANHNRYRSGKFCLDYDSKSLIKLYSANLRLLDDEFFKFLSQL
jgi:hypothetical protein